MPVMATTEFSTADPGVAEFAVLADWWRLAGVDVLVRESAVPWRDSDTDSLVAQAEYSAPMPSIPREAPAVRAAQPNAATADRAAEWATFSTLAELRAHVEVLQPGIPFADGDPASGVMFIGDSPSDTDLRSGRPFTGPAGQFLDRMLAAISLDRSSCYIALLCPRLKGGRPTPDDIAADLPLTLAHIRLAAPRVVVLLGSNPVRALANVQTPIGRVRGNWLQVQTSVGAIAALATYNPAYLLRRPQEKSSAWADLLTLRRRLVQ